MEQACNIEKPEGWTNDDPFIHLLKLLNTSDPPRLRNVDYI